MARDPVSTTAATVAVSPPMGAGTDPSRFDWSCCTGRDVIVPADRDKDGKGLAHAQAVAAAVASLAASVRIVEAKSGKDVADHVGAGFTLEELVEVVGAPQADQVDDAIPVEPPIVVARICDVPPQRVSWLWRGYLPAGKLVILDGDPNVGKSTLSNEFAAIVSTGGSWPDGTACPAADVLILSAEDGLADTIRPRLDAAGADTTRVHAIQGIRLDDGTLMPPTLADIAALQSAIIATSARLLVVDVLMAYVPTGVDTHKDQDIRRVLSRLSALAERTGCAVLLLRHLDKNTGRNPLYRGGGSIGIVGAARAGLLAAFDPDDPDRRVLAVAKSNLAAIPMSLGYQLVPAGSYGAARVHWCGENGHTARSLLDEPDEPGAATEAERWLEDYVMSEGGCVKSRDAKREAAKAGIAERTLKRAANSLKLAVESAGFPRETTWTWPANQASRFRSQNLGPTGPTEDDQQKHDRPDSQSGRSGQTWVSGPTEPPLLCGCGNEIVSEASKARGHCERCHPASKRKKDGEQGK